MSYCTVDELKALMLSELGGKNVYFSDEAGVDFSRIEGVNVLHLSCVDDFTKESNLKKYASLFGVKREKFRKSGRKTLDSGFQYDNDLERNYMRIGGEGSLFRMGGWLYDSPSNKVEKKYDMDKDDVSGVKVTLADKKVNSVNFENKQRNGSPKICRSAVRMA